MIEGDSLLLPFFLGEDPGAHAEGITLHDDGLDMLLAELVELLDVGNLVCALDVQSREVWLLDFHDLGQLELVLNECLFAVMAHCQVNEVEHLIPW